MGIKGLKRNFETTSYGRSNILNKSITIKDLLVYTGYVLLVLVLLFIVVLIPFMIGRASVDCDCNTINKTAKVDSAISLINAAADSDNDTEEPDLTEVENDTEEDIPEEEDDEEPDDTEDEEVDDTEEYDEDARYLRTDPRVAISYSDVDVELMNFEYEMRGADWGTLNSVKIMITNNQDQIIIPYTLKMKIYNDGEHASEWWDDETSLRDHLNIIVPGGYKIVELETHVSFSEVDIEKNLIISVFDEVGKSMTSIVKDIVID